MINEKQLLSSCYLPPSAWIRRTLFWKAASYTFLPVCYLNFLIEKRSCTPFALTVPPSIQRK